jgi:acetylornithine deacetylase
MKKTITNLQSEAIELLKQLISTQSFSREEDKTAEILAKKLDEHGISFSRDKNNIWAVNQYFDEKKPTILLNSHHDTVKPSNAYTRDPFSPVIEEGKLFGLGSNDAGGCLVSLLVTFLHFYNEKNLSYNFCFLATAEEEISGKNGASLAFPQLPGIDFAIVGEPTQMNAAIAEKGLMVIDGEAHGFSGHAARGEGENAIYKAIKDISAIEILKFEEESEWLGPVKVTVTQVEAGSQHNVVPNSCRFVIDCRTTDKMGNEELFEHLKSICESELTARSFRLRPSFIDENHPFVQIAKSQGKTCYGSPTTSDQAVMNVSSLKLGPGDSARSHTADEFIFISEIEAGISDYISMLWELVEL